MPRSEKRVRVERGLYKAGRHYYACATPPGERTATWRSLGPVGLMEARRLRDHFAAEIQAPSAPVTRTKITFGELAARWLDEQRQRVADDDLAPRTFESYEHSLRCHVLPAFADRQVRSITPDQLVSWIRAVRAKGLAQHTVHSHWAAANLVLRYAVRHGALASNPGDRLTSAERPTAGSGSRRALDTHEIGRLLAAAPERYRVSIACGLFSGLRVAELLGLVWGEIDFRGSAIRVRHQMGRDNERRRLKTPAASRDVVLMTNLAHQLRRTRLASPFSADDDLVFCASSGRTIGHRNLAARGLELAVRRAGLQKVTFHVLRHTFASILIAEGHDPVFVSRQLGHASPAITLHVYAHLFDAGRHAQQAREKLDARYGALLWRDGREP